MKKFFVNCLCAFIPNDEKRRAFRKKMMRDRMSELQACFDSLVKHVRESDEKLASLTMAVSEAKTEVGRLAVEKQSVFRAPTEYVFHGENNKLLVWDDEKNDYVETRKIIPGLRLNISGNNNVIKIADPAIIQFLELNISEDNNEFSLGKFNRNRPYKHKIIGLVVFMRGGDSKLIIGNDLVCSTGVLISMCEPGLKCFIGDNVRMAEGVKIFVSDAHPVMDLQTNKIVNYGDRKRELRIGNNCWIGLRSFIGKNASLADFTIVAAQSNVVKPVEESYTMVAGNPAKLVKRGLKRIDTWQEAFDLEKKGVIC